MTRSFGALVGAGSVVKLELLVTAASTIILGSCLLANVAVLVMRYSGLTSYQPSFRVPLSPVLQIVRLPTATLSELRVIIHEKDEIEHDEVDNVARQHLT